MTVITGRLREARLYLHYLIAPFRPGVQLPTFEAPQEFTWSINANLDGSELDLIVNEGRRQLDRQRADLEALRGRATALLTLCLAEVGLLSAGAATVFEHRLLIIPWAISVIAVLLSLGGAIALVSARADFNSVSTMGLAAADPPLNRVAALTYAKSVSAGDVTIATRITVFRGAVLLAVIGAILYATVWPATTQDKPTVRNAGHAVSEDSTCTTSTCFWQNQSQKSAMRRMTVRSRLHDSPPR